MDFHTLIVNTVGDWRLALTAAIELLVAIGIGLTIYRVMFGALRRLAANPERVIEASLDRHGRRAARWVFPLLAVLVALPVVPLSEAVRAGLQHLVGLGVIAAIGWGVLLLLDVLADVVAARHRIDVSDNLVARRIRTQTNVLERVLRILVLILTLAAMLFTFPAMRAMGASMLASAGLAALVIGMAAKPTLANLLAGVQIALAQPMRIEDAVIVENEWGWIEEINATYVVVRLWDWRRMVLPLSYFIEHPFQNWTRNSGSLIGSVYLYMDYTATAPIDALRQELDRIVHSTDKWLGGVVVLQVSDVREYTIELRALADAKDAPTAWDLRCLIREGLVKFLQANYPDVLPKTRASLQPIDESVLAAVTGATGGGSGRGLESQPALVPQA